MRRLAAAVAATGLMAGGAAFVSTAQATPGAVDATAVTAAAASFTPAPISWRTCGIPGFDELGAKCGYLIVPLDYAKPTGTKIKLAVSRITHTVVAAKYQGVMLVNPGGPGGSGLTLSALGQYVPDDAGAAYDWIGFDPRGVGSSLPALSCDGSFFKAPRPQYVPTTAAIESTWLHRAKDYATACDTKGGSLLDHVKTADTLNDMESLRKALDVSRINFYGFSYGSYLGQLYSSLYPTRMRRMVLDGIVDPRYIWYQANLKQDPAFEKSIDAFFTWVAKNAATYGLGDTEAEVEAEYYSALADLQKAPAGGKLGAAEWNDVFVSAGYYVYGWEDIAAVFAGYVHDDDWQSVLSMYQSDNGTGTGADNGYAMYLATQCTEGTWAKDWATWRADADPLAAKAPFITWSNTWFNTPCRYWGAASSTPLTVNGADSHAALFVSETLDAATPYNGALYARRLFPRAVLIEGVGGSTHAGSLSGVACTDDTIAAYLTDGTLPPRRAGNTSDVKCDPVPAPDPTSPAARSKKTAEDAFTREALQKLIGAR
jgi:pimeloyl-ACP methyl ester carboxylesterase